MSKTAIIFNSKTGFTQKYALWIAEETNATPIGFKECTKKRVKEILSEYDTVIFGSRLHAGIIEGLSKAKRLFGGEKNRFMIFTTGAAPADAPETEDILKKVWEQNLTDEERGRIPHFYMQAGLCYEKMPFIDKIMMKGLASMLKKKKDKNEKDAALAKAIESSFDISDRKYITPLTEYLKNQ